MKKKTYVKSIEIHDLETVKRFDAETGQGVYDMICDSLENDEFQDYAYGIYEEDILAGYCTLGGAEGVIDHGNNIIKDPEAMLLSDVYVDKPFRKKGYAMKLVNETIHENKNGHPVYLMLLSDTLIPLYEKCGFHCINEKTGHPVTHSYLMVCQLEKQRRNYYAL